VVRERVQLREWAQLAVGGRRQQQQLLLSSDLYHSLRVRSVMRQRSAAIRPYVENHLTGAPRWKKRSESRQELGADWSWDSA
jgi:hypothetical protein